MSFASVVVLAAVVALAGLAVWRNVKKGAPCDCGCSCGECSRCPTRQGENLV